LVQKNKQSNFAWVIAHNAQPLWKGVGLAPGLAEDMYSGQAEAFGLLAGLTFLQYYIICYDKHNFQDALLQCFCDNMGVLTNIIALTDTITPRPNDTTNDDRAIYLEISIVAA